jgi:protein-S-isoprenylcysteine O-methyltransferase Ste14
MIVAARRTWQDLSVRAVLFLWFLVLATAQVRQIVVGLEQPLDRLAAARLLTQICVVLFFAVIICVTVLRPPPLAKAPGWRPRTAALLGGYLIYALPFLPAADLGFAGQLLSCGLMLSGDALALVVLFRLGCSFSIMAEARRLVTDGPYAIVRHPLYCAEQIGILGLFLQVASWQAFLILVAQFYFQLERIRNEESVLGQSFPEYTIYAGKTARLIPGVW